MFHLQHQLHFANVFTLWRSVILNAAAGVFTCCIFFENTNHLCAIAWSHGQRFLTVFNPLRHLRRRDDSWGIGGLGFPQIRERCRLVMFKMVVSKLNDRLRPIKCYVLQKKELPRSNSSSKSTFIDRLGNGQLAGVDTSGVGFLIAGEKGYP